MLVPAPWPGTLSSTQTFKQVLYLWHKGTQRGAGPADFPEQQDL